MRRRTADAPPGRHTGVHNYGYDASGNETTRTNIATGDKWTYQYNSGGEPSSAWEETSNNTIEQQIGYYYDVFGQLIQTQAIAGATTTTTRYAEDAFNPAKMDGTGTSDFDVWAVFNAAGSLITPAAPGRRHRPAPGVRDRRRHRLLVPDRPPRLDAVGDRQRRHRAGRAGLRRVREHHLPDRQSPDRAALYLHGTPAGCLDRFAVQPGPVVQPGDGTLDDAGSNGIWCGG